MTTLYGIANCDTVKKARKWLEQENISYQFHDFRKNGFDQALLDNFLTTLSWEELLNKRSTSFRNLDDSIKQNLSEQTAKEAMLAEPTLIKRPVLVTDSVKHVGFKADQYATLFK